MILTIQIEKEEELITVELEGFVTMVNDSYNDEFGTVEIEPHQELIDSPKWNTNLYNEEQNNLISNYLLLNLKSIEKSFCDLEPSFVDDFLNE